MLKLLAFHVLTLALFAVISTVDIVVQRWQARRSGQQRPPSRRRPWRTALTRGPASRRPPRGTGRPPADADPPATPLPFPAWPGATGARIRSGRTRGTPNAGGRRGVRDA